MRGWRSVFSPYRASLLRLVEWLGWFITLWPVAMLNGKSSDGSGVGVRGWRLSEGEVVLRHHSLEAISDHDLRWVPPWLSTARSVVEERSMRYLSLSVPTKTPGDCKARINQLIRGFRGSLAALRKPTLTTQMLSQNQGAAPTMEEKRYLDKKYPTPSLRAMGSEVSVIFELFSLSIYVDSGWKPSEANLAMIEAGFNLLSHAICVFEWLRVIVAWFIRELWKNLYFNLVGFEYSQIACRKIISCCACTAGRNISLSVRDSFGWLLNGHPRNLYLVLNRQIFAHNASLQLVLSGESCDSLLEKCFISGKLIRNPPCEWTPKEADLAVLSAVKASTHESCPSIWVLRLSLQLQRWLLMDNRKLLCWLCCSDLFCYYSVLFGYFIMFATILDYVLAVVLLCCFNWFV